MKRLNLNHKYSDQAFLLALIFFLLAPIPVTLFPDYSQSVFAIIYSFLIVSGLSLLYESKRQLFLGLSLGLVSFFLVWVSMFKNSTTWGMIQSLSLLLYFSYLAYYLFKQIALQGEIILATIFDSISGYLLIGMIGGALFQLLEMTIPGSFNLSNQMNDGFYDLHYLSFITLTTIGFGDITPATPAAKSLTLLVGLAGQLYLTILIAMLIGKFLR